MTTTASSNRGARQGREPAAAAGSSTHAGSNERSQSQILKLESLVASTKHTYVCTLRLGSERETAQSYPKVQAAQQQQQPKTFDDIHDI